MKLRFYFCVAILFACFGQRISKLEERTGNDFKALISIMNTDVWNKDVSQQFIIYDGNVTNLSLMRKKLTDTLSRDKRVLYKTLTETLARFSTMMYTYVECKYAGMIVKALTFYFHTSDTLNCLIGLKKHLVKMIFNLFNFNDIFPNLRHVDQSFLIALITVNSFIHIRTKYETSVRDGEKKYVIARTINAIESFRCANCLVPDSDYYGVYEEPVENSEDLLSDSSGQTSRMAMLLAEFDACSRKIDIESQAGLDRSAYHPEMYDPTNFMLGSMIVDVRSDVGELNVKTDDVLTPVKMFIGSALTDPDLYGLLDNQMTFVEILRDIFCMVFSKLYATKRNDEELTKALNAYDVYTDRMLPTNYPPDLYDRIKSVGVSVRRDLQEAENSRSKRDRMKKLAKIVLTVKLSPGTEELLKLTRIVPDANVETLSGTIDVDALVQSIVGHENFESYRKMFRFMLSQKTVLHRDRSFLVSSARRGDYPGDRQKDLLDLRTNLFLYRSLLAGIDQRQFQTATKPNGPSMMALTAMELVKRNMAYVHDGFGKHHAKLTEILAPVTIYFQRLTYADAWERSDWLLVKQYLLLTVNLLERYELNNCRHPSEIRLNLDVFRQVSEDKRMYRKERDGIVNHPVNFDLEYVHERIDKGTRHAAKSFVQNVDRYSSWVRKFVPNAYFDYNIEFNSNVILWNGVENYVAGVGSSIARNVIDYNYLVKFQMITIKWLVHNVLKKMLYVHRLRGTSSGSRASDVDMFSNINNDFELFRNLTFPSRVKSFIDQIFLKFLNTFSVEIDDGAAEKFTSFLEEQIERLKLSETGDNFELLESRNYSLEDIQRFLKNDVKYATEILTFINESGVILDTDFFFFY